MPHALKGAETCTSCDNSGRESLGRRCNPRISDTSARSVRSIRISRDVLPSNQKERIANCRVARSRDHRIYMRRIQRWRGSYFTVQTIDRRSLGYMSNRESGCPRTGCPDRHALSIAVRAMKPREEYRCRGIERTEAENARRKNKAEFTKWKRRKTNSRRYVPRVHPSPADNCCSPGCHHSIAPRLDYLYVVVPPLVVHERPCRRRRFISLYFPS